MFFLLEGEMMKRKVFEHYQPYKLGKIAKYDLGNNENRIIDWSFLPQKP